MSSSPPSPWKREDFILFSDHCPFGPYRERKTSHQHQPEVVGDMVHLSTECILTESWHLTKPAPQYEKLWYMSVASNSQSHSRIHQIINNLFAPT
ncbi:hypothetical protein AVEN_42247-1 [Araneus ventricosus]|uniref:Uncharacterized protein n=1 Tax=Araneus ventricosus TaxID=182803 RepID=A0A4Y2AY49_ARAVE|nr:hypothetical protein AVEN_42247-1 [Araneus ventricosus]